MIVLCVCVCVCVYVCEKTSVPWHVEIPEALAKLLTLPETLPLSQTTHKGHKLRSVCLSVSLHVESLRVPLHKVYNIPPGTLC